MLDEEGGSQKSPYVAAADDVISFGEYQIFRSARQLTKSGVQVRIGARAFDILAVLVDRVGEVVTFTELLAAAWPNRILEESNLRVNIAALRKALSDRNSPERIIRSVPGQGYSFVAKIVEGAPRRPGEVLVASTGGKSQASIPALGVRLIGRDAIIDRIARELPQKRFITISGAGGVGKTCVALAVANGLRFFYENAVPLDLASITAPSLVAPHLASLLGLPTRQVDPIKDIIEHLRHRKFLIVLDNCEHLTESVSKIAELIIEHAYDANILAASREPLRARGERVWRLEPLRVPPLSTTLTAEEVCGFPAAQLFIDRARASHRSWVPTDLEAPAIAEICNKLDGLPLAIELAAARVQRFGVRELAQRLNDPFKILAEEAADAAPGHQTLSTMIKRSFELLSNNEKFVWCRLSLFRGTFTIEGAEAISDDGGHSNRNMIDILGGLVEKSMVAADASSGVMRYRLLETLRVYAFGILEESGQLTGVKQAYADYCHQKSIYLEKSWILEPSADWLRRRADDISDIRAALDWAFGPTGDVELGIKLTLGSAPMWFKTMLFTELRRNLERAIEAARVPLLTDGGTIVRLNLALGSSILGTLGDASQGSDAFHGALTMAAQLRDLPAQFQAIFGLWAVAARANDCSTMVIWTDRAGQIAAASPDLGVAPLYNRMAGLTHHMRGNQSQALQNIERARAPLASPDCHLEQPFALDHRVATNSIYARVLWLTGRAESAEAVVRETVEYGAELGELLSLGYFLNFAAVPVAIWTGNLIAARTHTRLLKNLKTLRSGSAFEWERRAEPLERLLDLIEAPTPIDVDRVFYGPFVSPHLLDFISTADWRLLSPRRYARAEDGNSSWCAAELLRAKGELIISEGQPNAHRLAEGLFLRSLTMSRSQGAKAWQLRCSASLARLWRDSDRIQDARALLESSCKQFTEGLATRDLLDAWALLDTMA